MGVINIVVPPLKRRVFSGGILCIFEYAKGLSARGHEVNIVPLLPSPAPQWVKGRYGRLITEASGHATRSSNGRGKARLKESVRNLAASAGLRGARFFPHEVQRGFQIRFVRALMPAADVTLATSFETALPVHLYGAGRRFYFMQHFEPYFAVDMEEPKWAEHEALASYQLGLNMIANSSWLQATIRQRFGAEPALCPNAIDHDIFNGEPKSQSLANEVQVISYGGSQASWKGIHDMAAAVQRVRREMPHRQIRWLVFGDSLLPPQNEIASYEFLGFLQPEALARAYRSADILLSASWYESFPLFPIEAMACGLPVVTTQAGTEEYAVHERTAEIVQPRDPESIARGLSRLIEDSAYRITLARNGAATSRLFSWTRSVDRMEAILFGGERAAPTQDE